MPQLQLVQTGKVKEILAALGMNNPVPYKQITECFVQVSCFYSHRCEHTHAVEELAGRCTDEITPVCTGGCSWEILSAHTHTHRSFVFIFVRTFTFPNQESPVT